MSAIRTFALVAVATAALAGSAQAQGHPMRGHGQAEMQGHFANLNLTEAQKAQIKAIHTKYQAQLKASREQAKASIAAARTARQKGDTAGFRANMAKARQVSTALREQEMNEVRAVLTPAQRAQADSMMASHARNGAMPGMRRGAMMGGPGAMGAMRRGHAGNGRAFQSLNLTDAQKTQIKAIRAKYQGQVKTTREQEMNEIRAVLTADQRAKLDSSKARRMDHGAMRDQMRKGDKK